MSLTGLNDGDFTNIAITNQILLGGTSDSGSSGQVIKSDGTNSSWSNPTSLIQVSEFQTLDWSGVQAEADASTGELYQTTISGHQVLAIKT